MIIETPEDLELVKTLLRSAVNPIAVDTETNVTDNYEDRFLVGISLCIDGETFYIPVGHKETLFGNENFEGELDRQNFFAPCRVLIFHNAKFDLHVLRRAGFKIGEQVIYDTMLMHHYIDEYPPHALKDLGKSILGYEESKELQQNVKKVGSHFGWEAVPTSLMGPYAEQDAKLTYELFFALWPEFEQYDDLWREVDMPFMLLLTQIEESGLIVDLDQARSLSTETDIRMQKIRHELGFDPQKPSQLAEKLFSAPPKGIGLTPTSFSPKTNKPSTDAAYLESVGHPVTALVLEYRRCLKMKSSYYDAYGRLAGETGRIHPNFKQHGTVTGRLSCENPNLQQIPRSDAVGVKKLFLPEPGCQLWELDFRTIEYRLAALYAEEEELIQLFRDEGDYHQLIADTVGVSRHQAKTLNYTMLFGGQAPTIAARLGIRTSEAEGILNNLKSKYPGIFAASANAEIVAENNGFVKMWSGRHRHFRYRGEERKAFNSIIQGGAFEIMKRGMLNLAAAGLDIRNQVHDSVWLNIKEERVSPDLELAEHLLSDWTEEAFGLRFSVDRKRLN